MTHVLTSYHDTISHHRGLRAAAYRLHSVDSELPGCLVILKPSRLEEISLADVILHTAHHESQNVNIHKMLEHLSICSVVVSTGCCYSAVLVRSSHHGTVAGVQRGKPSYAQVETQETGSASQWYIARHLSNHGCPNIIADTSVTKRPLNRPSIASPYANASHPKIIYMSPRTPFLSAVKRVEKLLNLADKRGVQAATTLAKQQTRKRKFGQDGGDEIGAIAGIVEEKKRVGRVEEEVIVKGTGKAIGRVMEIGMWFQKRDAYDTRLKTGTVGSIDDIEVAEKEEEAMDVDDTAAGAEVEVEGEGTATTELPEVCDEKEATSGARLRYLSVLEVAISLR